MARAISQLTALINERAKRHKKNANRVMRVTFLQLADAVAKGWPVDEGISRGNWNVSFDSPNRTVKKSPDKNKGYQQFNKELGTGSFLEHNVYLTNASPYAVTIEYGGYKSADGGRANGPKTANGFSKQAPNGSLRKNVKLFNKFLIKELAKNG